MRVDRIVLVSLLTGCSLAAVVGCGSSDDSGFTGGEPPDTGAHDAAHDVTFDIASDVPTDAHDSAVDAPVDSETDAKTDSKTDAPTDSGVDAADTKTTDSVAETSSDSAADVPADTTTDTTPDGATDAPADSLVDGADSADTADAVLACTLPSECPGPTDDCQKPACNEGTCGTDLTADGTVTSTQTPGDCQQLQCNGTGTTKSVEDDADKPVDGNDCTDDVCTAGVPSNPALTAHTPCSGGVCNGAKVCVGCVDSTDCTTLAAPFCNTTSHTCTVAPATLQLNEVNPNITGSADLVELLVSTGGTVNGIKLQQDVSGPTTLATLPSLVVAAGDIIVVHLNPASGVTTETASKTDCTSTSCYSGAWDVDGGTTGITFSDRVLRLLASDGSVLDAVPFVRPSLATPPASFPPDLQSIQGAGLWLPADCAGSPCTYATTPSAFDVSADWTGVGTGAAGNSISRKSGAATKTKADWSVGATTFGAANP